jgi:hypothetical protein
MQKLQEQISDIAMDGVYAEIAGANFCKHKALREHPALLRKIRART